MFSAQVRAQTALPASCAPEIGGSLEWVKLGKAVHDLDAVIVVRRVVALQGLQLYVQRLLVVQPLSGPKA